jgi:hypothetical protein
LLQVAYPVWGDAMLGSPLRQLLDAWQRHIYVRVALALALALGVGVALLVSARSRRRAAEHPKPPAALHGTVA